MNKTDPLSANLPPFLPIALLTSAVERLGLSDKTLTMIDAPP